MQNNMDSQLTAADKGYSFLPEGVTLAKTDLEIQSVINFRESYCDDDRGGVKEFHNDGLDHQAYVMYSTNLENEITSTVRLLLDSESGFPEEKILPQDVHDMRKSGKKIAELGRLVISTDKGIWLRKYYKAIYDISKSKEIDYVLVVMKRRNVSSHKKIMSVTVLSNEMGHSWDEEQGELCLVSWDINADQPNFHKWVNKEKKTFQKKEWDEYSPFHLSVLLSVQHEVYENVSLQLKGRVADLGCGSGRMMGYIQENSNVSNYTGVDLSDEMIKLASWLKEELEYKDANLINESIENIKGQFDTVFSIHSFYTWPDQDKVLKHVYQLLVDGGQFILVTPNNNFDTTKLSRLAQRELLGHPNYERFMAINHEIAVKAEYLSMDHLIGQVRKAGFKVKQAHQNYFLGGASYLQLEKL